MKVLAHAGGRPAVAGDKVGGMYLRTWKTPRAKGDPGAVGLSRGPDDVWTLIYSFLPDAVGLHWEELVDHPAAPAISRFRQVASWLAVNADLGARLTVCPSAVADGGLDFMLETGGGFAGVTVAGVMVADLSADLLEEALTDLIDEWNKGSGTEIVIPGVPS